jgi:hypothetical protein
MTDHDHPITEPCHYLLRLQLPFPALGFLSLAATRHRPRKAPGKRCVFCLPCVLKPVRLWSGRGGGGAIIDQTLVALLAGGHVLIEGVPGLG